MQKTLFLSLLFIIQPMLQLKSQGITDNITVGRAFSFGHAFITNNTADQQFLFSLTGGLSFTYSDNEHYGFGADIVIANEGGKTTVNNATEAVENKVKLTYVRLPIKYIWFLGTYGKPIRPKVFVGPSFAYLTAAETNGDGSFRDFNKFDAGIHVGVGANKIICSRIWLNTDITYTQGFLDVTKNTVNSDVNLNGSVRLNISLLMGLNRD